MMYIKLETIAISILSIFTSCSGGGVNSYEELSGGYTYAMDGGNSYVLSDNTFRQSIYPSVKGYVFNDDFILIIQSPSKKGYKSFLSSELWSKYQTLITADSTDLEYHPRQFNFYREYFMQNVDLYDLLYAKGMSTENNIQDRQISEFVADSLIKNDPIYQNIFSRELNYWIISHKERNEADYLPMSRFYGPYSKEEYLSKRVELGVPYDLKLVNEDELSE